MRYATAYTARFTSHNGVGWRVEIGLPGYEQRPLEIGLDYDEPVTIDWKETEPHEAVQSSICTVKVVNDTDRQMADLMQGDAICSVYREESLYWMGLLDDSVYEEPYSQTDGYVTELTFSDFGVLKRREYSPNGVMSLYDIVRGLLSQAEVPLLSFAQVVPLYTSDGAHVSLGDLSVNTERFEGMSQMEVLDGILRPLNLRVIQRGGILVYDTMGLFDNALFPSLPVAWKGTDARMRGGRTYGWYNLSFAHDAKPVIADGSLDPKKSGWDTADTMCYVPWYDNGSIFSQPAYYIYWNRNYGSPFQKALRLSPNTPALFFLTRSATDDSDSAFVALRAVYYHEPDNLMKAFRPQEMVYSWTQAGELMSVLSRHIPTTAGSGDFQIRISLELLLSPKYNPFEDEGHGNYPQSPAANEYTWEKWKKHIKTVHVPVKLELLDESGDAIFHYHNADPDSKDPNALRPLYEGSGAWESGPASWSDMVLSYYKDGREETLMDGWAANRQSIHPDRKEPNPITRKRESGEYVPMPPAPGRLRLSVSDTVNGDSDDGTYQWLGNYDLLYRWQAYRDPRLTIVKKDRVDDGVDQEDVAETDVPGELLETFSETLQVGSHEKGLSPASMGMLLDTDGAAVGNLVRNGVADTLVRHRLHSLEDQFLGVHEVLSGTAEAGTTLLCAEASSPGYFLVTARREDLLLDTEEVTMVMVHPMSDRYTVLWGAPVCASAEARHNHRWSRPVCLLAPDPYTASWNGPVCARKELTLGPVWHELTALKHD